MSRSHPKTTGLIFPDDYFVVDVGMHDGSDSLYYAKRGFRVVGFEANPILAAECKDRFAAEHFSIEVRNLAVSKQGPGAANFFLNKKSNQFGSLNIDIGSRAGGSSQIKVVTCSLSDELAAIADRIHYIKIDIEGADYAAVEQLGDLPFLPPYISVENGGQEFVKLISKLGYSQFKYSNQKFNSKQWIPRDSPHGHFIKHFFPQHSSGPFGEDVPGRWLSPQEASIVGKALSEARKLAPNNLFAESIGWFDMHARL